MVVLCSLCLLSIADPDLGLTNTHSIAQISSPSPVLEPQPTPTEPLPVQKPRVTQGSQWNLCGRKQSKIKRVSGFTGDTAGTYIHDLQVDIHGKTYSTVTLNWANADLSTETLPIRFNASPRAGRCDVNCRSIADSKVRFALYAIITTVIHHPRLRLRAIELSQCEVCNLVALGSGDRFSCLC